MTKHHHPKPDDESIKAAAKAEAEAKRRDKRPAPPRDEGGEDPLTVMHPSPLETRTDPNTGLPPSRHAFN
ncbi:MULTISPECIES: hypothetical protein [unclassified Salinibacterium]|uniref:hypothetical protein n=1 Tax=unclassified Salinibacterium TaxID=2632331 RepID=UPI001421CB0B|nr:MULTISPECIES: hypothetical protein [unclassified Salinibacterium]